MDQLLLKDQQAELDSRGKLSNRRPAKLKYSPFERVKQFSTGRRAKELAGRAQALGMLHEEAYYDHTTDALIVKTHVDSEPLHKRNRELQNAGLVGDLFSPSREFRWVASISPEVQMEWMAEGVDAMNDDHWPEVQRRLNDSNWQHTRTGLGRI